MTRALSLVCVTFVVVVLGGATAIAKPQIAVLGVEVVDKAGNPTPQDSQVAQELTKELRARAKTSGPYALDPGGDKELNDEKLLRSCDSEAQACMQLIGKDLAADFLMYGHIEKQNNAYQVTMVLFDVIHKTKDRNFIDMIPLSESTGPQLVGWARKIYGKLTGQNDSCIIVVKSNTDAGTILVNGTPKGSITNGVGQVTEPEGRYKIAVEANKDYHRWEKSDVTCTAGQTTNLPVELEKIELGTATNIDTSVGSNHEIEGTVSQSPDRGPWPYVTIGSGVLTVASLGALIYYRHELYKTQASGDSFFEPGGKCAKGGGVAPGFTATDSLVEACNDAPHNSTMTAVTFGGTIVFGGIAIYGLIQTLRHHDSGSEHLAHGHRVHKSPLAITPIIGPNGGGATLQIDW
jgi:hypothetical protein